MKKFLQFFVIVSSVIALAYISVPDKDPNKKVDKNLPWQILISRDGYSHVFGLALSKSTVGDALSLLGPDREMAILLDQNNIASLEVYYGHFSAGPLQGKLVISTLADQAEMFAITRQMPSVDFTESGLRKFIPGSEQLDYINRQVIDNLTFIPTAQLDHNIIIGRFGEPTALIKINDQTSHYLYPHLGLDIALNREGKETLQYIAPRDFSALSEPLYQQRNRQKK